MLDRKAARTAFIFLRMDLADSLSPESGELVPALLLQIYKTRSYDDTRNGHKSEIPQRGTS